MDIIKYNFIPYMIIFTCLSILNPLLNPCLLVLYISILFLFVYWVHRFTHYNETSILNYFNCINFHYLFHHDPDCILPRSLQLFIECCGNIFFTYFLPFICFPFIPHSIILFYAIVYTTTHIVNYSILHNSKFHILHHEADKDKTINYTNFSPDICDFMFGTKNNDIWDDTHLTIPNILVAFIICLIFNYIFNAL